MSRLAVLTGYPAGSPFHLVTLPASSPSTTSRVPKSCTAALNLTVSSLCGSKRPSPPYAQPGQKSYKDFNDGWPLNSWPISEVSNGYQVAYIRLLSKFV